MDLGFVKEFEGGLRKEKKFVGEKPV